jgi:hypothetical protein
MEIRRALMKDSVDWLRPSDFWKTAASRRTRDDVKIFQSNNEEIKSQGEKNGPPCSIARVSNNFRLHCVHLDWYSRPLRLPRQIAKVDEGSESPYIDIEQSSSLSHLLRHRFGTESSLPLHAPLLHCESFETQVPQWPQLSSAPGPCGQRCHS